LSTDCIIDLLAWGCNDTLTDGHMIMKGVTVVNTSKSNPELLVSLWPFLISKPAPLKLLGSMIRITYLASLVRFGILQQPCRQEWFLLLSQLMTLVHTWHPFIQFYRQTVWAYRIYRVEESLSMFPKLEDLLTILASDTTSLTTGAHSSPWEFKVRLAQVSVRVQGKTCTGNCESSW